MQLQEYNILVVDDDSDIVDAIAIYLNNEEFQVIKVYNGKQAVSLLETAAVHLIIMDIMMPEMDGITALLRIRAQHNIPVIFLSAKSEDTDKIMGLNMGADDYVTKPFQPLELIARVKSQLRRYTTLGSMPQRPDEKLITAGGLVMNIEAKTLTVDGEEVRLTPTEYKILELLMENAGRVYSIDQIYDQVWNEPGYRIDNTVAVHIRRIREKIEINPKDPKYLKVVWGVGYKIERI